MKDDEIRVKFKKALQECARLRNENSSLRIQLGLQTYNDSPIDTEESLIITNKSPSKEKIKLFRSLFRGREDVYPVRWESKKGKAGYSPACAYEWDRSLCNKPEIKCGECNNRKFLPVTDEVIHDHLTGKHTIGVYPLLPDETCWFLAIDFDKADWREDILVFMKTCDEMEVPIAVERSRSGNGGHIWILFEEPLPAPLARKLGCAILTRSMEKRDGIGFDSYDRLFPNQDTMPKGGFGNLIALPLQKGVRDRENTLFLDKDLKPYHDQWQYLSALKKISVSEVSLIVEKAEQRGKLIGAKLSRTEENDIENPWELPPSGKQTAFRMKGTLPDSLRVVRGNLIYVKKEGLPTEMCFKIKGIAAFQNPDFYKAQAMRLPTYDKPRVVSCFEDFPEYIGLPRGCFDELQSLLESYNITPVIKDERYKGKAINYAFHGTLTPLQKEAADVLLQHDEGILSATTAFGKTVIAAKVIAERQINTLVIVHRRQIMDQWKERLALFLNFSKNEVGQIGGGKENKTGKIDIAMIQSLNRNGLVKNLVAEYGQVIVDECHHISAFSFEQVLKKVKAKYLLGLTATPIRKDGHHPIIEMQCGPIRFKVSAKSEAKKRPFDHFVIPRHTDFRVFTEDIQHNDSEILPKELGIQDIYAQIISDKRRNDLIFDDTMKALEEGRSPLVLTERTEHVDQLAKRLQGFTKNIIILKGGMGAKQRREISERLNSLPDNEERLLIATGRYIGEGFDDSRLDTLFLTMPISWHGTLQQYAGRMHRLHQNKRIVQIYDYVDVNVPMLLRMYRKRLRGYKAIGYKVQKN